MAVIHTDTLKYLSALSGVPLDQVVDYPFCFQWICSQDLKETLRAISARPLFSNHKTGSIKDNIDWLKSANKKEDGGYCGIYVVVNQTNGKGRTWKHVTEVRALFIEVDHGGLDASHYDEFRDKLGASIVVESSPGKCHVYWLVEPGVVPLDKFKRLQILLQQRFAGIQAGTESKDLPRVLRVPDFLHLKSLDSDFIVRLHHCDGSVRYNSVDEIFSLVGIDAEFIKAHPDTASSRKSSTVPSATGFREYKGAKESDPDGARNDTIYDHAYFLFKTTGMEYTAVWGACQALNREKNDPPMTVEEVTDSVTSAHKRWLGEVANGALCTIEEADLLYTPDGAESYEDHTFAYNYNALPMACPISDESLAERIMQKHGAIIKYCSPGGFYVYNDLFWEHEADAGKRKVSQFMRETFSTVAVEDQVQAVFASPKGGMDVARYRAFKRDVHSAMRRRAALELLSHRVEIATTRDKFYKEADSDFIAAKNGIVDLKRGELVAASPEFGFTSTINCSFDLGALCPIWDNFISTCMEGDKEQIAYLQRVTGYLLSGRTNLQCLFVVFGQPGTGKSTYLEALGALLGSYRTELDPNTLIADKGSENAKMSALAQAVGCRLATIQETSASDYWAANVVKAVTGNDMISAKRSHKDTINFHPRFKMCIRANEMPNPGKVDVGLWDRLKFVPFEKRFRGTDDQDRELGLKLAQELPGIFNWAVRGFQMLIENGKKGVGESDAANRQKAESQIESDPTLNFIVKCCVECSCEDAKALSVEAFDQALTLFCRNIKLSDKLIPTSHQKSASLKEAKVENKVVDSAGRKIRKYSLRLKTEEEKNVQTDDTPNVVRHPLIAVGGTEI